MMELDEAEMDNSDYEEYNSSDMQIQKLARLYIQYGNAIDRINKSGFRYMDAIIKEVKRMNIKEKNPLKLTLKNSNADSKWAWELYVDVPVDKSSSKVTVYCSFDDPNNSDVSMQPLVYIKTTYIKTQLAKNFFSSVQKKIQKTGYSVIKFDDWASIECDTDVDKDNIRTIASKLFGGFKTVKKIVEESKYLLVED